MKTLVKVAVKTAVTTVVVPALALATSAAYVAYQEYKRVKPHVAVSDNVAYRVMDKRYVLGMSNMAIACALKLTDGTNAVVIDSTFKAMPLSVQEAILAHEEGHIALGHVDNVNPMNSEIRTFYIALGRVQPIELEADLYAAKKTSVAQVINALEYLKTVPNIDTHELDLRIKALMKHNN